MSDTVLQIIPFLPEFTPSAEDAAAAESAVTRAFASADAVTRITSPSIVFRDAGANFESVSCPQCGSEVDQEWWEQAMSAAAESPRAMVSSISTVQPKSRNPTRDGCSAARSFSLSRIR